MADVEATEARFLELTKNLTKLTLEAIDSDPVISTVPRLELLDILISLLANGKLEVFQSDSQTYYKLGKPKPRVMTMRAAANISTEEQLILQIIEPVGSKGIWAKDIRSKSGLNQPAVTRVLNMLETKRLVKSVTPVQAGRKKKYFLFDVTPDSSLTGGPWWFNGEFDYQFVELVHKNCIQLLEERLESAKRLEGGPLMVKNGSFLSSAEILQMVIYLNFARKTLSVADIECILNTIVYDGKAEMCIDGSDAGGQPSKRYRMIESLTPSAGLSYIPCGVCPMINRCSTIGSVTAKTCEYFDSWGNVI